MKGIILGMPKDLMFQELPFYLKQRGEIIIQGVTTPSRMFKVITDMGVDMEKLSKKLGRAQGYGLVMTLFAAQMTYKYFEKKGEVEKCQKALAENLWEDEFEDDPMDI